MNRSTIAALVLAAAALTGCGTTPTDTTTPTAPTKSESTDPAATPDATGTPSQMAALAAARNYLDLMPMSEKGLRRQLTSEFDQHTKADAEWAVEHLGDVDWTKHAVEAARVYRDDMSMSLPAIEDQLASPAGDAFTAAQAKAAVDALRDEEGGE